MAGGDVQVLHRPELVAKVTDIVGLYLAPPENAIVLCIDEKSPDPSVGSNRADAADATRDARTPHPRLRPQRHHHVVRRLWRSRPARSPGSANQPRHQEFLAFLTCTATHQNCACATSTPPIRYWKSRGSPKPPRASAFHPDRGGLDEHGRDLVRHGIRTARHSPRHLRLRERPHHRDPHLHRRLELPRPPIPRPKPPTKSSRKPTAQRRLTQVTRRCA